MRRPATSFLLAWLVVVAVILLVGYFEISINPALIMEVLYVLGVLVLVLILGLLGIVMRNNLVPLATS